VVVDRFKAKLWTKFYPNLTVRDDLVVNKDGQIAWAVRKDNPKLKKLLGEFIAANKTGTAFGNDVVLRYFKDGKPIANALADSEAAKFHQLAALFSRYGASYGINPSFLAAQGYQESRLDQTLRNRSGAVGIMQIKPSTAAEKDIAIAGVDASAEANINAGAKYLRFLATRYLADAEIGERDRVLMALAAYNAGPGSLRRMRELAAKQGLNPNVWFRNVETAAASLKGVETVQYVSNIYKYYVAYSVLMPAKFAPPASDITGSSK
jgi:membrane-bound lytic murein transglycosylase MltF